MPEDLVEVVTVFKEVEELGERRPFASSISVVSRFRTLINLFRFENNSRSSEGTLYLMTGNDSTSTRLLSGNLE